MSEITVTTPPGVAGPADVVVTNPDGQSAVFAGGVEYLTPPPPPPTIASITPRTISTEGGTQIAVVGADFEPGVSQSAEASNCSSARLKSSEKAIQAAQTPKSLMSQ